MRKAEIYLYDRLAGLLVEDENVFVAFFQDIETLLFVNREFVAFEHEMKIFFGKFLGHQETADTEEIET